METLEQFAQNDTALFNQNSLMVTVANRTSGLNEISEPNAGQLTRHDASLSEPPARRIFLESNLINSVNPWLADVPIGKWNDSPSIHLGFLASSTKSDLAARTGLVNSSDRTVARDALTGMVKGSALANVTEDNTVNTHSSVNIASAGDGLLVQSSRVAGLPYPGHLLKYTPGREMEYDSAARQWQDRMKQRGWNIVVDGLYGPASAQICRQFQAEKGLDVDGIVGPNTWREAFRNDNITDSPSTGLPSGHLLKYVPGVPLKRDVYAKQWQARMQERGWNIDVDGLYGPASARICRQFQAEKGLAVDGIVGPDTWATAFRTDNITGSPPPIPTPTPPSSPGLSGSNPSQQMINIAKSYIGVREQGTNRGPEVEMFQKAVDGRATGEAWCMSFVQYCIETAENTTQARSSVFRSEHCLTVWSKSPSNLRRSVPEPGSVVIWRHGNSQAGHTGIVEKVNADGSFVTVEGNTSGGSGVNREGDGVYRKTRYISGAGNMKIVGFLKIF